jgi:hypothetical protein
VKQHLEACEQKYGTYVQNNGSVKSPSQENTANSSLYPNFCFFDVIILSLHVVVLRNLLVCIVLLVRIFLSMRAPFPLFFPSHVRVSPLP